MATQAARSAFEALAEQPQSVVTDEMRAREPRYLFYAGDEPGMPSPGGLMVQSPVVPDRTFWRCAVTPALSAPVRMRKVEIPEGRLLEGTEDDKGLASMILPCGPEVDEMLAAYGHPDRTQWQKRWGLVELTPLRGMQPRDVAKLNLTATFFPEWPNVPDTNAEVEALLVGKIKEIEAQATKAYGVTAESGKMRPDILPEGSRERIMLSIAILMLDAVKQAQEYQKRLIQQGNMRVTYPDTNDGFKPGFDSKDELFALRSGVGLAVNSLRGNQSDAAASSIGAVLEKVLEKFQPPQQAAIDPNQIAAIVAATVQALNAQADAPQKAPKLPVDKKA